MFGNEYYGNLKITVRGLCSEVSRPSVVFMHGCALCVGGKGALICGSSGAGKTTITEAMRRLATHPAFIVNDDWGSVCLESGRVHYTGERNLHMKYRSVLQLAPSLAPSPDDYPSENYAGNADDPHARLLIPRAEVFGPSEVIDEAALALVVVILRDTDRPFSCRPLQPSDVSVLERGFYSAFYDRHEYFLNGSLFLTDDESWSRYRSQAEAMLRRFDGLLINNAGSADVAAKRILTALDEAKC